MTLKAQLDRLVKLIKNGTLPSQSPPHVSVQRTSTGPVQDLFSCFYTQVGLCLLSRTILKICLFYTFRFTNITFRSLRRNLAGATHSSNGRSAGAGRVELVIKKWKLLPDRPLFGFLRKLCEVGMTGRELRGG